MKVPIRLDRWRAVLSTTLPGDEAQQLMAPAYRGSFQHTGKPLKAGVMILLYPFQNDVNLVFIKRNEYEGHHSGQVSFPGGAFEPDDRSLLETALRETREELGIDEEIQILGTLTPLHIPVSNFMVYPAVGWTISRPEFKPDPTEVKYLIESPVGTLLDPSNRDLETITRHGKEIVTPYYKIGKEKIWGATAMILSEFLQLASRLQPHHY
jgi:8-oxo-dGTP pyrophosphatase MutT (NUDIX family)